MPKIGKRINEQDVQLMFGNCYAHNWVLNKKKCELSFAAKAFEVRRGRVLDFWTTEPGLHFYAGNFLAKPFLYQGTFCLEAQLFLDSPNKSNFPSAVLKKGKTYRQTTIYKFSVKK